MTDLLPISLVAHHAFCPRRAWLEAAGERSDIEQLAIGTRDHAVVDDVSRSRAARVQAFDVASDEVGVIGRCDTVEATADGQLVVVEHKATPVRKHAEVTGPMRIQLCLQALALRSMGHRVSGTFVYFTSHGQRIPVRLTAEDEARARAEVSATRLVLEAQSAPPALEDDPRCSRCSHVGVCLPDERPLSAVRRRILVADPDSQVVHLTTPGTRASVKQGRLVTSHLGEPVGSVPLERIQGLVVHGNVDVSAALLRELMWRGLSIVWCSGRGRVIGWSQPADSPNGAVRPRQHLASSEGRLDLAREFVAAKICNQATLLRRSHVSTEVVPSLRDLQKRASSAASLPELYGVEGDAAARYFGAFPLMLARGVDRDVGEHFPGRLRRPSRDPLNAALNYTYGLLLGDVVRATVACGLDPHAGFLHSSGRNKPALCLDLMEELRAPVADSTVIRAFNNGEIGLGDFANTLGETRLRESGRRAITAAYERRITTRFVHPVFRYDVTWRRAVEIQARMVLGVLDGTQRRYVGLRIR